MQLAHMVATANEPRSISAKLRESLLAMRMERAVDKHALLEQWMNRAYFGNGAYGFAAASELYFGRPPAALSDAEAALLACLPRAPTAYDPAVHLEAATRRRDRVLALLVERGVVTDTRADEITTTKVMIGHYAPTNEAPHFARWIVDQLPADVRHRGGTVQTTLDLRLQRIVAERFSEQAAQLHHRNLDQAGAIVLDTQTTEVRAMVGSIDWNGAEGQINITTRPAIRGATTCGCRSRPCRSVGSTKARATWRSPGGCCERPRSASGKPATRTSTGSPAHGPSTSRFDVDSHMSRRATSRAGNSPWALREST